MPTLIVPSSVVGGQPLNAWDLLKLRHTIPPYQRDYVWNEKEVEDLWTDLIAHYTRSSVNEQLPKPEGYFLGAMVVVGDGEEQPFEVVDGQQRLTCLSTIVAVMLDKLDQLQVPERLRRGYEQVAWECLGRFVGGTYEANLTFSDVATTEFFLNSCLIRTSRADKESYWATPTCAQYLSKKRSTISRIRQAIVLGYEKLSNFIDLAPTNDLKCERLISFFRLVTECVVVLRIKAHSHSNAYAIFESLNNRGVRLSQADLIKNDLLKAALVGDIDEIKDNWSNMRQSVDASDVLSLPEFLHFSYLSRFQKVKANDLFEKVKAHLGGAGQAALAYSKDLVEDSEALEAVTAKFSSSWTADTVTMLKDIMNVLGAKLCYPFLFAVYSQHATSPASFEAHVRLIMNLAFRHLKVIDGSLDALASTINHASRIVRDGGALADVAALFRSLAPDALFQNAFETSSFYNTKLAYFAVYYLEKVRLNGTMPLPHSQESNLEHIMPRNPAVQFWPMAFAQKKADPDLFREYLWRVGNLLPLPESINKSIKNREIGHKISNESDAKYLSDSLTLISPKEVSEFLCEGEWTYESIEGRQRGLAAYAPQAWPL